MYEAKISQGWQTWRVPGDGEALAFELAGQGTRLIVRMWSEGEEDHLELALPAVNGGEAQVLYRGPVAALGGALGEGTRPITCPQCQHRWTPRVPNPAKCPACSYRLRRPRRAASPAAEERSPHRRPHVGGEPDDLSTRETSRR
jgi:hypothetical protein